MRITVQLFIGALLCSLSNLAAAADWRLDVLVFERDRTAADDGKGHFQAIDWPAMLALDNDAAVALDEPGFNIEQAALAHDIQILSSETSSLTSAARRLNSSGRYRVISEYSVAFKRNAITPMMRLHDKQRIRLLARDTRDPFMSSIEYWRSQPDLAPPVDTETLMGWFKLEERTHPMLSLDISFIRTLPGSLPIQILPDGVSEFYRDQVRQYRLSTTRKLTPGKLAYFDHPEFGALARLSALQTQPSPE